ncbi:MAG: isoprenylcysteine carboxylmethyltransferase family protein [Isosphaera sp.]|nr:isoprenylcysteine carboxylmethyltransferase family protein [Isosphaera sp.]
MSRFATVVGSLAMPVGVALIVFASAGRWDLPFVWGVLAVLATLSVAVAATADPGLVRERVAPGPGNRDRVTRPVGGALLVAHWVLAGLDVGRFHWSPVPPDVQLAGLVGYVAASAVLLWAVSANPFYSSVVRVQADRGHRPVTAGPYRLVRHPGYTATLAGAVAGGLALGSWVAVLPLLALAVLFVRRTVLEDRLLRAELPGYAEYARRVRYRLVAGVF